MLIYYFPSLFVCFKFMQVMNVGYVAFYTRLYMDICMIVGKRTALCIHLDVGNSTGIFLRNKFAFLGRFQHGLEYLLTALS